MHILVRSSIPVGCLILLLLPLPASVEAQTEAPIPRFEQDDCPAAVPDEPAIECGSLVVPEDYAEPGGVEIRLPVIIIKSRNESPAPDPLLFAGGLPGTTSLRAVEKLAASPLRDERDIIILERRGGRLSEPNLDCELALMGDNALPCLENLQARGADLANYVTAANVSDLNALRQLLDYDDWNLLGDSYGTLLMLSSASDLPEGVRSLVLDSVQPATVNAFEVASATFDRALSAFFAECRADKACSAAYPNLEESFYTLVDRLDAEPVTVEIVDRATGSVSRIKVDGDWFLAQTFDALYGHLDGASPLAYWPLLITELESGNTGLLHSWLSEPVIDWSNILTFAAFYAVVCQEGFAAADPQALASQAENFPRFEAWAQNAFGRSACESWQMPASELVALGPMANDIPTLILAGSHDPVAAPGWGQEMAAGLSSSYFYEFPNMGNWVSADSPCAQAIIASFLDDPSSEPEDSCLAKRPGPQFALASELGLEPGLWLLYRELFASPGISTQELLLGLSLLLFVAELIFLVVTLFLRVTRGNRRIASGGRLWRMAHFMAGLLALLNLGFVLALSRAVNDLAVTSPLLLRFGLPATSNSLLILPLLTDALTAAVLVIAFAVWIAGQWSTAERVFYSLVTLAAIVFSGLMAHWGLLLFT